MIDAAARIGRLDKKLIMMEALTSNETGRRRHHHQPILQRKREGAAVGTLPVSRGWP